MWPALAVGLGTGLLGMYQQDQAQKQQARANQASMLANAAAMEYSPWTGMGKEMIHAKPGGTGADVLGAGLQSGLQGFLFGSQFGKKSAAKAPEKPMGVDEEQLLKGQYQGTSFQDSMNRRAPSAWFGLQRT